LTSTAIRAYSIGQRLKAKGIPVIIGGVHPTFMPALGYSGKRLLTKRSGTLPHTVIKNFLIIPVTQKFTWSEEFPLV
jgi:hypothetical protein